MLILKVSTRYASRDVTLSVAQNSLNAKDERESDTNVIKGHGIKRSTKAQVSAEMKKGCG